MKIGIGLCLIIIYQTAISLGHEPSTATRDSGLVKTVARTGRQGSGFVVCREHRLVATAAHVADDLCDKKDDAVYFNGQVTPYSIARIWYHPRTIRELDRGLYVYSRDSKDGGVYIPGPDVAIMRLNEPFAPDVKEYILTDEISVNLPVRVAGFPGEPGSDGSTFDTVSASSTGFIGSIYPPVDPVDNSNQQARWIESTAGLDSGASGSALLDQSDKIVGVFSGSKYDENFENLSVHLYASSQLVAEIFNEIDEDICNCKMKRSKQPVRCSELKFDRQRRAARHLTEAEHLLHENRFFDASNECNNALAVYGGYRNAHMTRSRVYLSYVGHYWDKLNTSTKLKLLAWSHADASYCNTLGEPWIGSTLLEVQCESYRHYAMNTPTESLKLADRISQILDRDGKSMIASQLALFESIQGHEYLLCGRYDLAKKQYDLSIKTCPEMAVLYSNRSKYYIAINDMIRAREDIIQYARLLSRE